MQIDNGLTTQIECSCGAVFEPVDIVVDEFGERWAVCPDCKTKIRLLAKD
jgi:hypothetical protein